MPEELILKQFDSEVKEVEGERAFNVTITTNDVDRSGDIVEPKGARLTNFKKNPVVLLAHDYRGLPIAKASNLIKTDTGITAKVTFPDEGIYPLADTVYNLYKYEFMRAWSIGFIPIKSEDIVDDEDKDSKVVRRGTRFKIWEMLEFSGCSVPDNPNALKNMLSKGIDVELLKEEGFIEIIEDDGTYGIDDRHLKMARDAGSKLVRDALEEQKDTTKPDVISLNADGVKTEKASIDEDEKEKKLKDIGLFDVRELAEIVNRNKELVKEKDELKIKLEAVELKAGAVLNAKNKTNLKNAQKLNREADTLIQSVLDSAGTTEEDSQVVDDKKDDKGDDGVVDIITDTVNNPVIDEKKDEVEKEAKLQAKAEAIINQSMTDNRKYFKENLDYESGRVKK